MNSWPVVGAQQVAPVGLHRPEPGALAINIDIARGAPIVLATVCDGIDPPEDARDDVVPAHLIDVRVDAILRGAANGLGDLGGVDEHLGGDAADIQAGTTESTLFA